MFFENIRYTEQCTMLNRDGRCHLEFHLLIKHLLNNCCRSQSDSRLKIQPNREMRQVNCSQSFITAIVEVYIHNFIRAFKGSMPSSIERKAQGGFCMRSDLQTES